MPKTIKEVYQGYDGYTTVEYSDDSTRKYSVDDIATFKTDPLTGGILGLVGPDGALSGFPIALYRLNTPVTAPVDTNENTLATVTIPAGAMGLNGVIRVSAMASFTNNANAKTVFARLGGNVFAQTAYPSVATFKGQAQIQNRNSEASQIAAGATSGASWSANATSTAAVSTFAINTAAAQTLTISVQKATAGDSIVLESLLVELIPGA